MMKSITRLLSLFVLLLLSGTTTWAQGTQAAITGSIKEAEGPAIGATVSVRNESTGFQTSTVTNEKGDFSFAQLPLGTPYTISVKYVGFADQKKTGYSLNFGDQLKVNFDMKSSATELDEVSITGADLHNSVKTLGASTAITEKELTKLPVNGRNFTSLIDLSPVSNGSTLAGQLASSTNYTVDGMTARSMVAGGNSGGAYSISMEAIREFKVVTNEYDVTNGRSGGGSITTVTKSGTNTLSGSAFTFGRTDWLSSSFNLNGSKRVQKFSTYQYGASLGGAIVKDRAHFFVAWDHQRDSRPLYIADIQAPSDIARYKVTQESLDEYSRISREKYGIGADEALFGAFDKKKRTDAAFARIDWQINSNNLLTIRDNYTNDRNKLGLADNTAINAFESYGNDYNIDNSLLATLRTTFTPKITNELKLQHLYTYQKSSPGDQLPAANIPRNIVETVRSTIEGGTLSTNIQMGGHRFAQEGFTNNVLQLVDNFYYNTDKVQYTFGVDLMYTHAKSLYGSEVNGRFHYNETSSTTNGVVTVTPALDNFNNLRPYRFYREVPLVADPTVYSSIFNTGAYGQLSTRLTPGLEMTAGLRFDYAIYPKAQFNQLVFDELKLRTDNQIKSFILQPRIQFNWDINNQHRDFVRFGAGVFASDINNYMLINNLTFDGKHFATVDVRDANVPTPDFAAYRSNYASIPTLAQFQVPTINMTGPNAKVPTLYKANVSYSRFLTDKLKVGISGYMSLGRNNYMYVERNMVADPFFRLANEDNRGVYVPLASMPTSGVGDWQQGRLSQKLGRVLELNSEGRVNQFAAVVDATWQYFRDGEITASYTWNDARDNVTYNGNVANTATLVLPVKDDPRNLSKMTYSDNQFRNKVVFYGTLPSFFGITVGVRYTGIGGTRYSLLSGANTNADFVATNDLAFVFDRNSAEVPTNVRTGLQTLLDNPDANQSLKNYINAYSGKIAERNGGING
ncbi:MAG: TonB-dependent receptor, partial [Cytophagaceae bacterium]